MLVAPSFLSTLQFAATTGRYADRYPQATHRKKYLVD
jgi:hypothetical protein